MDQKEQLSYKYVLDIEGHVAAFRLSKYLSWASLILKVDSSNDLKVVSKK